MSDSTIHDHDLNAALPLDPEEASGAFAALGSEARLNVLRLLVRAGPDGMTVGDVKKQTGAAASTLSHHLRFLTQTGLMSQEKSGRKIICRADFDRVQSLAAYLTRECCLDAKPAAAPTTTQSMVQAPAPTPVAAAPAQTSDKSRSESDDRPHRVPFRNLVGS